MTTNKDVSNSYNAYAVCLYICAYLLSSVMIFLAYNIFSDFDLYEQVLLSFVLPFVLSAISFFFKDGIADMISRLSAQERLGLSILFIVIVLLPIVLKKLAINIVFLIYLLSVLLCNEKSFCRLYFADMLLMFLILMTRPQYATFLLILFFALLSVIFALDYFKFKYQKYGDRGEVFIEHPFVEGLVIFVISLFLFLPIYFLIPAFHPVVVEGTKRKDIVEAVREIRFDELFSAKDIVIIILLVIVGFLALRAFQWFLLKRKGEESLENVALTETGAVYRRKKKKIKKLKKRIKSIRDEVIYLYNNLCYDLSVLGFEKEKFSTPNEYLDEFRREIREKRDKFEEITRIFEKARYSQQAVLKNDVETIKNCYKEIEKKVKDAMYFKSLMKGKKIYRM